MHLKNKVHCKWSIIFSYCLSPQILRLSADNMDCVRPLHGSQLIDSLTGRSEWSYAVKSMISPGVRS